MHMLLTCLLLVLANTVFVSKSLAAPCEPVYEIYSIIWHPPTPQNSQNWPGTWAIPFDVPRGKVVPGSLVPLIAAPYGEFESDFWELYLGQGTAIRTDDTCLDAGASPWNGTPLKVQNCSLSSPKQKWDVFDAKGRTVNSDYVVDAKVRLSGTNLCVDVAYSNMSKPLQLWGCGNGNRNQVFEFFKIKFS